MWVKLGDKVQDVISGFSGVASGRSVYLNGCVSVLVAADRLKADGELVEAQWFDEQRLRVVQEGAYQAQPSEATAGGPAYPSAPKDSRS